MPIKSFYLIFAFFAVSVIARLYGVSPRWFAATFLDAQELDLDPVADDRPAPLLLLYVAMALAILPAVIWVLRRPD